MDEISREILDQTKGVAVEIYKDGLSPSVKPLGEVMSLLPRTIKIAFSGWERWLVNKEESLRLTAYAIEDKLRQIPEEKIVEPDAHVAIPAIQQLCYCQDSDELRDLYANLLTSSMNTDKKWQVHPAYVDIIKQLCPDEAKYLKAISPLPLVAHPLIDVQFSIGEKNNGVQTALSNFTDYNLDKLEHPENICSYIDNLVRLNLIEIPAGMFLKDQNIYQKLESHQMIQLPVGGDQTQINYSYKQKMFWLTNFGANFIKVVCQ